MVSHVSPLLAVLFALRCDFLNPLRVILNRGLPGETIIFMPREPLALRHHVAIDRAFVERTFNLAIRILLSTFELLHEVFVCDNL